MSIFYYTAAKETQLEIYVPVPFSGLLFKIEKGQTSFNCISNCVDHMKSSSTVLTIRNFGIRSTPWHRSMGQPDPDCPPSTIAKSSPRNIPAVDTPIPHTFSCKVHGCIRNRKRFTLQLIVRSVIFIIERKDTALILDYGWAFDKISRIQIPACESVSIWMRQDGMRSKRDGFALTEGHTGNLPPT